MVSDIENKYLINAPAGSGKTTKIKSMINNLLEGDNINILCITFTNRAADELLDGVKSDNVEIKTIHSFMNSFMNIYFSHKEIMELYFDIYGIEIKKRIENKNNKSSWNKSNERYKDKYGDISYSTIKENINRIEYNELSFNTLYTGGLSHDDLLSFSKHIIDNFDIIKKRVSQKFNYIFIDEYQDTSDDVLSFFYESIENTNTRLYLLGDRMQQIYSNYDGTFEEELKKFDTSIKMNDNYRSSPKIITVLNNIYNDPDLKQEPGKEEYKKSENIAPRALILKDIESAVNKMEKEYPKAIKLYTKNSERFKSIGAGTLYASVSRMDKYSFGRKYSAVDILTDYSLENPDILFKLLFCLEKMYIEYQKKIYGEIIQEFKYNSMFKNEMFKISLHAEKEKLSNKFSDLFNYFDKQNGKSIQELLEYLNKNNIVKSKIINQILEDEDYTDTIQSKLIELMNIGRYLREEFFVSTQHGVKGEGHETVFFICDDAPRINIKIYDYFRLWTYSEVNFSKFQSFYYSYLTYIDELNDIVGEKIYKIKKNKFEKYRNEIIKKINEIYDRFEDNIYFNVIYSEAFNIFKKKLNVTSLKPLKSSKAYSILTAYKIFYVGCSRAKKQLIVFIDENKINEFKELFIKKLEKTGFIVD